MGLNKIFKPNILCWHVAHSKLHFLVTLFPTARDSSTFRVVRQRRGKSKVRRCSLSPRPTAQRVSLPNGQRHLRHRRRKATPPEQSAKVMML